MAFSEEWEDIAEAEIEAGQHIEAVLMDKFFGNCINLREWLGKSYYAGAAEDHTHDATDSALLSPVGAGIQELLIDTEYTTSSSTWVTLSSELVYIPSNAVVTLDYMVRAKYTGGGTGYARLTCASADGSEIAIGATSYAWDSETGSLDVSAESGWTTINVQGKQSLGNPFYINRAVFRLT